MHTDDHLTVAVALGTDRARVSCRGELDLATGPILRKRVDELLSANGEHRSLVLIDLTELTFCDSTGIRTLLELADQCGRVGATLRITNVPRNIGRVFEITGTAHTLNVEPATHRGLRRP